MKSLLVVALGCCAAVSSFAVPIGEVDFENFSNTLIYTNSVHNGPATGLMSGTPGVVNPFQPGSYIFALFAAPTSQITVDASLSGWDLTTADGVNTVIPGLMNGNDDSSGPSASILGWGPGETANFVVVGWSANIGTTWGAASAWWNNGNPNSGPSGYFAISGIAQDVLVGGADVPIPTIFGPTAGGEVQGFTLNYYSVPEPSTFSLACLAAMLSLFRFFRFAVPNKTNKINHI